MLLLLLLLLFDVGCLTGVSAKSIETSRDVSMNEVSPSFSVLLVRSRV